jgi:hypothetical protein
MFMSDSLFALVEAFVPKEILLHFDLVEVKKEYNVYRIYMVEKEDSDHFPVELRKLPREEVVKSGYLNPVELQTFPIAGHEAFIYLRRRRWKKKGTRETFHNSYDFMIEGTKSTRAFGIFLKEIGRG